MASSASRIAERVRTDDDLACRFERVFGPRLTADQYRKRHERRARTVAYAGY